jgi:hypothetical protein
VRLTASKWLACRSAGTDRHCYRTSRIASVAAGLRSPPGGIPSQPARSLFYALLRLAALTTLTSLRDERGAPRLFPYPSQSQIVLGSWEGFGYRNPYLFLSGKAAAIPLSGGERT